MLISTRLYFTTTMWFMMIHPNNYKVNQAWLSTRVNDTFLYVAGEPYDMYILVDVASCYVFGFVYAKTTADEGPDINEIDKMFTDACSKKRQYPIEFYVEEDFFPKEEFKTVCQKYDISFKVFPKNSLCLIVDDIKETFEEHFDKRQVDSS